jgi:predicted alpha-1,2-mannosidase
VRRALFALLWAAAAAPASAATPAEVDPFTGAAPGANTTPAAQVPFGFAAPGPDMVGHDTAGYVPGGSVLGFSQTHVSGTGGAGKYGNFRVLPGLGPLRFGPAGAASDEVAAPGYYAATVRGIRGELTAARLAAYHRYSFPGGEPGWLALDAASVIAATPSRQRVQRAFTRVTGPRTFVGGAHVTGGWGIGGYRLYFAAKIDGRGTRLSRARRRVIAHVGTARRTVGLRIGLSFRSTRAARAHLRSLRGGFTRTRTRAGAAWRRALAPIEVSGGSEEQRRVFATALYHAQVMPHDLSGDNAWWRSREPHYEDFYALWDTSRTVNPLLTLIARRQQARIVRSLIDTWRHTGWLPDARVAGNNGLVQVGSNAVVVIADALSKRLPGVPVRAAYRAVRKDAEVDSRAWWAQGRQLDPYRRLGYVPLEQRASASRTLEYSYGDYAASVVAARAGRTRDAARWRARSLSWRNLWDPESRYVRPRDRAGRFMPDFDPHRFYSAWEDPFYEGTAVQWSAYVPHDAAGLIERLGGDAAAVEWLGELSRAEYGATNEVALLAPYLYTHAGRPDLTARDVTEDRDTDFSTGPAGLPGNDDAGTLSAWYVWSAIGLYPNAGQPFYYIGSPLFDRARIDLGRGRSFTVERRGTGRAVVAATLDGRPLDRAWLTHREVAGGGTLVLVMGDVPSPWGTADRPPSPAG